MDAFEADTFRHVACVLPGCFVLAVIAIVGVRARRPAHRKAASAARLRCLGSLCVCCCALTRAPPAQADLHFRATGQENWAPLLLFVGFLGVVVFAARPPAPTPSGASAAARPPGAGR